jgi:hypothetical protein
MSNLLPDSLFNCLDISNNYSGFAISTVLQSIRRFHTKVGSQAVESTCSRPKHASSPSPSHFCLLVSHFLQPIGCVPIEVWMSWKFFERATVPSALLPTLLGSCLPNIFMHLPDISGDNMLQRNMIFRLSSQTSSSFTPKVLNTCCTNNKIHLTTLTNIMQSLQTPKVLNTSCTSNKICAINAHGTTTPNIYTKHEQNNVGSTTNQLHVNRAYNEQRARNTSISLSGIILENVHTASAITIITCAYYLPVTRLLCCGIGMSPLSVLFVSSVSHFVSAMQCSNTLEYKASQTLQAKQNLPLTAILAIVMQGLWHL